jgi:hypothetical protein
VIAAYRPLFATRRARRVVAASLLGRLAVGGMFDFPLILLARESTGSYAVAGGRSRPSRLGSRYLLLCGAEPSTGSGLPLALADSLVALGGLLLLAGMPFTAQWAARSLALDGVTPAGRAAEAYNWLATANAAGVALGGVIAGVAIETAGVDAAFLAGAGATALAAGVVVAGRTWLS